MGIVSVNKSWNQPFEEALKWRKYFSHTPRSTTSLNAILRGSCQMKNASRWSVNQMEEGLKTLTTGLADVDPVRLAP